MMEKHNLRYFLLIIYTKNTIYYNVKKARFYRTFLDYVYYSNSVVPNLFLMVNHVKYGILIFHNYLKCLVFLVLFEEIVSF